MQLVKTLGEEGTLFGCRRGERYGRCSENKSCERNGCGDQMATHRMMARACVKGDKRGEIDAHDRHQQEKSDNVLAS